jgi:hypothetical protein
MKKVTELARQFFHSCLSTLADHELFEERYLENRSVYDWKILWPIQQLGISSPRSFSEQPVPTLPEEAHRFAAGVDVVGLRFHELAVVP